MVKSIFPVFRPKNLDCGGRDIGFLGVPAEQRPITLGTDDLDGHDDITVSRMTDRSREVVGEASSSTNDCEAKARFCCEPLMQKRRGEAERCQKQSRR
jgi:hypothetical protein